jgi:TolB protein
MPYRGEIYLLSVDGKANPKHIAKDGSMPAWSPDGQRIAYVSLSGDDGYHALYLANRDGSGVEEIVPRTPHAIDHPAWSPDGSRIALTVCDLGKCDVEVVTPDGTVIWKTAIGDANWPVWSSDGRWVAFTVGYPADARVAYTDAATGTALTLIADGHTW